MPAALFGGPSLDFDSSKYCFRAIAVPAALFWSPFLDLNFSKYHFRAIALPAALFGGPFFDLHSYKVPLRTLVEERRRMEWERGQRALLVILEIR